MKRLSYLFTVAVLAVSVVVVSLATTSCSKDDDNNGGGNGGGESPITNSVSGTWSGSGQWGDKHVLTFRNDGTGAWVVYFNGRVEESESFSYTMAGNSAGVITVKVDDSYSGVALVHHQFKIEGKKMSLYHLSHGNPNETPDVITLQKE